MKVATYEFEAEHVDILPLGDLHLGSEESMFEQAVEIVENTPDVKIILLGDLIDNAIAESLGDVYSQTTNPHGALQVILEFLTKYKERILGVVSGNHERRTWRKVGVDPIRLFCEELQIPYADDLLVLDIGIKGKSSFRGSKRRTHYAIACHHGSSGGRFPEKSMRQHRYFQSMVSNVDIYITGHTHVPQASMTAIYEYDPRNKNITIRNMQHITIPAWTEEKYARQKLLAPSAESVLILRLYGSSVKHHEVLMQTR
ncbi:DNA repair exonuclease [Thermosipho africanus H17ap60334]|uniref:metallophosphoesterase n=1 Tax=Thermosipho africanus TaxID=2421 RepID=UPI00028D7BC5|nr:metallophosphoesterase [Thermosipho africanus]EKF49540.1 DNA repair exonuclease [Thermosipho africanus H17ap60334]